MDLRTFLEILAAVVILALAAAVTLLAYAYRRLRRIRLAADADFFTTMRAVPLSLVVGLDLLDLGLDVFSTPITWVLLDRLGLKSLRNVASLKAMIPIADMIPALTIAWLAARFLHLGKPNDPRLIETERVGPGSYAPRPHQD
ncbi:MAG TPA: hypothetical protein VHQ90_26260 [Thermoanaerobaculia bacterium]|nr:hypothetical protein [Thermoanaerobaculia bacterium]